MGFEQIGMGRARRMPIHILELESIWEIKKDFLSRYDISNAEIGVIYGQSRKVVLKVDTIKKQKTDYIQNKVGAFKFDNIALYVLTDNLNLRDNKDCQNSPSRNSVSDREISQKSAYEDNNVLNLLKIDSIDFKKIFEF